MSKSNELFRQVICPVDCRRGAPMGRYNKGNILDRQGRVYDRYVPIDSQGYDRGGAYWGLSSDRLRVTFDSTLSYIRFYRESEI